MSNFIKVQVVSIIGSLADYLITILLAEILNYWYLLANGTGNICGGSIQFILLRNWVFKKNNRNKGDQISRFILVFAGSIILSAAGVYFFTQFLKFNYIISKTIISVLLGTSYNYYFQKKFVFGSTMVKHHIT